MFARKNSFFGCNLNLATLHSEITQLQSKLIAVFLLGLFSFSIFSLFFNDVALEEKELNYQNLFSFSNRKKLLTSHILPSETLSNPDKQSNSSMRQDYLIDIDKMKKVQIEKLDKNENRITDDLEKKITKRSCKGNRISVIVSTKTNEFQDTVLLFENFGGVVQYIWDQPENTVYGFSGEIDISRLKAFSEQVKSSIELIEEDLPAIRNSDVATHLAMIRTHVWDNLNYTGDPNMAIAVLDTGIDDSHLAFSPGYEDQNWSKKIVGWYDATEDGSTTPEDYVGHGSHVSGIVAANEYNNSYDNGRIATTWSYSYNPGGIASGAFTYVIWVNRTGTIDISYVWRGTLSAEGTELKLYAPNGTLVANDTSGNSNMTLSHTVSSSEDFGYWEVGLGVSCGVSGGMLDLAGVNKYPYPDPKDDHSRFAGVAPDVKLVGVKIFDQTGFGTSDDVIEAFNWIKSNKATYHIAIASGSFGFSETVVSVDSAAAALVNSGVTVVLSAGNDGQGKNSIFSPGQVNGVITVAALDDYDRITAYSSEGPGEMSNTSKPDIVAPGGERTQGAILQVDSNDADSKNHTWSDKISNDFTNIQGTSMACPFVSGSLALLIQAMGGYDYWKNSYGSATNPFKVKQLLLMTGNEIYLDNRGRKDVVEGYGRLNIYAAIEAIENTYEIGTKVSGTLSQEIGKRKVWAQNVTLTAGINYTLALIVPNGADFDLFIYEPDPNQFGEPILAARSANFEFGADEYITYTPNTSGIYYLVIKTSFTNKGSGTFYLTSTSGSGFPVAYFVSPIENEKLTGQYRILIDAEDSDLKAVYCKIADDSWINTTFTGTYYEYEYNTTALPDGNISFVAKVVDSQGHITFTSISNTYTDNFNQPILLVDDDIGEIHEKYYERTLKRLSLYEGIGFDYYSVQTSGSPSANKLKEYQLVIWFTSNDSSTTLTTIDQSNLQSYLDNGGYLWISGQDIGYDINTTSFYGNYLHAVHQARSVTDNRYISGVSGEIFEGKRYFIGAGAGSGQYDYPSDIDANTGAAVILNYYDNSSYGAAIKYNGTHKVIYCAFNWEAMDDEIDRMDSLNRSINWFALDERPTSVLISSPTNGTTTNRNPTFSWIGIDDYGIEKYAIFREGIYLTTTSETSITLNDQPEGWHSYKIVAFDEKNQSNTYRLTLFIDRTPPLVCMVSPLNITYSLLSVPIYATNLSTVHKAWYRYMSGFWSINYSMIYDSNNARWEAETPTWGDGGYLIQVFFNDSVGNEAFRQEWFSIDTTGPTVTIISPSNTTYKTTLIIILATNSTIVHKAWYRYRSLSWSSNYSLNYNPSAGRWENLGITLIDGNYRIQIYFNDSVGNEAFSEEYFSVDTTAPIVILNSPNNTTYIQNSVMLDYFVSDGVVTIYLDGIANTTAISSGSSLSNLSVGSHNITIIAIDTVGHIARASIILTVESFIPPTTTTTIPITISPTTPPATQTLPISSFTPFSSLTPTTETEFAAERGSGFLLIEVLIVVVLIGISIKKSRLWSKKDR